MRRTACAAWPPSPPHPRPLASEASEASAAVGGSVATREPDTQGVLVSTLVATFSRAGSPKIYAVEISNY